jgi:membrane fusion protein, multidrug efflux system
MDEQVGRVEIEAAPGERGGIVLREPPPRSRWRGRVLLLLLLTGAGGAIVLLHPWTSPAPPTVGTSRAEAPQPVREAVAVKGDMPVVLQGLGTVSPLATVLVKTQINGQLTAIAFKEGQLVKKGDFLAQIDPRPYQVALEQAQGQLAHDQALLKQAETNLARYLTLLKQDSISRQQTEDQRFLVLQYQGSIQTDQALIDNAKLNLTYCHIVSPVDGRVGLRQVDAGNFVQTTDPNGIVVITELQPISVVFPLPQDTLEQVMARLRDGSRLEVAVYDHDNVRRIATGTLETVDNQIDTTTGTAKLRAVFANTDDALFPNEFVNAHLVVNTLHDAVVVPSVAVQTGAPGTYVWLVRPDNTVVVRRVEVGPSDGERIAILAGLAAGDKVVTDGIDRLREGSKVTVPGGPAEPAPPAGAGGRKPAPGRERPPPQ